jgi:hypothetical protein
VALDGESSLLIVDIFIRVFLLGGSLLSGSGGRLLYSLLLLLLALSILCHVIEPHQDVDGGLVVFGKVNGNELHLIFCANAHIADRI